MGKIPLWTQKGQAERVSADVPENTAKNRSQVLD